MRAAIFNQYGTSDVLEISDLPKPTLKPNHILVKVQAAAINPKDTFIRKGRFKQFTGNQFPQFTGFDVAGKIVASDSENLPVGAHVFGMLEGWHGGTCAEYVLVQSHQCAIIPNSIRMIDAAALPLVTLTALQALRDEASIKQGMCVCINGASGGVGSMAVQIAKIYGAHVTAIASQANHDFLYEIGADACIDYHETDIRTVNQTFDIFFDVFGNTRFADIKPILTKKSTWVSTVIQPHVFISMGLSILSKKRAKLVVVKAIADDLAQISEWVATEKLKAIIHSVYPLEEIRAAHQQQESKHTRGKIVITV